MSRLDRLLRLLEAGSSPATRSAAAQQVGECVRARPQDLPLVLSRVHMLLRNKAWETRKAAGSAVEAIAKAVPEVSTWWV